MLDWKTSIKQDVQLLTDTDSNAICFWDAVDIVLVTCYIFLFLLCVKLLYKHRGSIFAGNINGLTWYLLCTSVMCLFRTCGFIFIPLLRRECSESYSYWQWDIGGSIKKTGDVRIMLILLILSSSSSALFFTSYSYLAYSLAKVLDMLTSDHTTNQSNSGYSFLLVILAQNICVWLSVFMLWIAMIVKSEWASMTDGSARILVSISALTTGIMFSTHVVRASVFLRR